MPPGPGHPGPGDASPLLVAEFAADPVAAFRRLRERHGPVAPVRLDGGVPAWLVLGYRELRAVTSQPGAFGRDSRRWAAWPGTGEDWPLRAALAWTPSVRFTEGAGHARRAAALSDVLDAIDPARLEATAQRSADRLIDAFARHGTADLMAQYAQQMPIRVLGALFGPPGSGLAALIRDTTATTGAGPGAREARQRLLSWVQQVTAGARERPGPAAAARLLAHPAGLSDAQAAADMLVMTIAAQQPTADWIGNTLRRMLIDDEFSVDLQGGRLSVPDALNAVLWADPPVQNCPGGWAVAAQDLGGRRIAQGDLVILGLGAVAGDPLAGAGTGTRLNRAHLAFGHGPHGCPSPAPDLAAIIARAAVEVLLDRLPDVRLAAAPGTLRWRTSLWLRGLAGLPARFTPAAPPGGSAGPGGGRRMSVGRDSVG